jgi:hypothetical protein
MILHNKKHHFGGTFIKWQTVGALLCIEGEEGGIYPSVALLDINFSSQPNRQLKNIT